MYIVKWQKAWIKISRVLIYHDEIAPPLKSRKVPGHLQNTAFHLWGNAIGIYSSPYKDAALMDPP